MRETAVHLMYPPFFLKNSLFIQTHNKTSVTALGLDIQNSPSRWQELDTCSYETSFSQWPKLSPPKILTFLPEPPYNPPLLSNIYSATMRFLSVYSAQLKQSRNPAN